MAWEDLEQDIAELFSDSVTELTLYEDRRNQQMMHVFRVAKAQPRTVRRAAVCTAAQNRWRRKNSEIRRRAAFQKLGRTVCGFPGCSNLLTPPWRIRRGRVSATCDKNHSRELAALRRAAQREHPPAASSSSKSPTCEEVKAPTAPAARLTPAAAP